MKKQIITITALLFTFGLCVQQIISNPTGSPLKASGGPQEGGATCSQSGCHFGTPTTVSNIITTDIPALGYIPGATYNITATVTGIGAKGLMVSAQSPTGNFLGTMIAGAGSKIVFSNYLTHTTDNSATSAIWSFKWMAPAVGSGPVTFYGAFAITRNTTRKQQLVVNENTTTAVADAEGITQLQLFPNPVANKLSLNYNLTKSADVTIALMSVDGKSAAILAKGLRSSGKQEEWFDVSEMNSGIYLLKVSTLEGEHLQKVVIQH